MKHPIYAGNAFSLVELSIVLVILGLLTGGILAGQSLIRASEIRTVSTDYGKYQTAIQGFRDKYFAIPGDFKDATKFWDSLGSDGADINCAYTAPNGTRTCNGNGNGDLVDYQAFAGTMSQEYGRFWQHLANAGLVEGGYSGFPGTIAIGTNVAAARIGTGAYFIARASFVPGGTYGGSTSEFRGNYGRNMFVLMNGSTALGGMVLRPEEAWNIDTKMDDGLPNSGKIYGFKGLGGASTRCTDKAGTIPLPANEAGAQYALSVSSKDCQLYFVSAF